MDVHSLPAVNATLNGIAAVLLAIGYTLIRKKRIQAHKRVMLTAFAVSVVFLACYLIYHFNAGIVYYQKTGFLRYTYLTILTTHTILAVITPVLALITLGRGLPHGRPAASRHRTLDVSHLDVCERHGRGGVFDAVSILRGRTQNSEAGMALTERAAAALDIVLAQRKM